MRSYLECLPCFFEQTRRAAELAGLDEAATWAVMCELGAHLSELDPTASPPENCLFLYRRINELSGRADPFRATKAEHTEQALKLIDRLRSAVRESTDTLGTAVRIAAAGNRLDLGALGQVDDPTTLLDRALAAPCPIWDLEPLRSRLDNAESLLLLGDNAGETVFDRVLLETVARLAPRCRRCFVARGGPIINDATVDDAGAAGLDQVAELISTGSSTPGVPHGHRSRELEQRLQTADVVIAKGQGNYESLSDIDRELFFILTVKCRVVASHLGVDRGASVLLQHLPR
jgi:hypothetical protein